MSGERDGWLDAANLDFWDINISFYHFPYMAEVRLPYMVEKAEGGRFRHNSR